MTELGWGIVGPGGVADRCVAPAVRQAPGSRLVAVCSRSLDRAQLFASSNGAEAGYDDLGRFLQHPGLDVVYVATPDGLHEEPVVAAARAGKHVLCELVLSISVESCLRMIRACRTAGVVLGTHIQHRHSPANKEMRRLVQEGAVGEVLRVRAQYCLPSFAAFGGTMGYLAQHWEVNATPVFDHPRPAWKADPALRGGGVSVNTGPSAVDLLRSLLDREVEEVFAYSDGATAPRGLETVATVLLRFEGGIVATMEISQRNPYADNDVVVYGTQGRLASLGGLRLYSDGDLELVNAAGRQRTEFRQGNVYVDTVEIFNQAVHGNGEFRPSGVDGLREREINLAWVESTRTGRPVRVQRHDP